MKYFHWLIFGVLLLVGYACFAQAQRSRQTREEYIVRYKNLAVKQMKESGIPASIILAQACLESGDGNSRLATEANNHFGIKCHNTWTGARIFHDDDAKQECFRKYDSPEGSFSDHSDFLRYRDRYKFLFDLQPTDYEAWAKGLKQAGYATNPHYADQLIKIIEDYKLYKYDTEIAVGELPPTPTEIATPKRVDYSKEHRTTIIINRQVYEHNDVRYVVARTNDTYELIANEYDLKLKRVLSFNDVKKDAVLEKGQVVYIESKKSKATKLQPIHIAEEGETLWQISQRYAVSLSALQKYNLMKEGQEPVEGQEIYLRNKLSK